MGRCASYLHLCARGSYSCSKLSSKLMYLNNSDIKEEIDNPIGKEDTSDNDYVDITPALPEYFFMNYCFEFFFLFFI